jgi:hypothetical protein
MVGPTQRSFIPTKVKTLIQIEPGEQGIVYYPAPFWMGWGLQSLVPVSVPAAGSRWDWRGPPNEQDQ